MQLCITVLLFYVIGLLATFSAAAKLRSNLTDIKTKLPEGLTIESLQVGSSNSRKSKATKSPPVATTTTTTSGPFVEKTDEIIYRLNGNNGAACILISTDGVVDFDYETNIGEIRDKPLYLPEVYEATGNCDKPDEAYINVSWEGFNWIVYFSKTPGGEHWYVSKMEMILDTAAAAKVFEHIKRPPKEYKFSTPTDRSTMLFPTPVGKAYRCEDEITIDLKDQDIIAKLSLRKLKMQPFIFKKDGFGPEFVCTPGGAKSYRDETAPIAVGSTLAIVTLLTVTGYGVYRYMKVKKVQYDTME
ncbi:UNVERIFIED_CONTAM: hypothetical protein PYX00_006122 [Menopon gallinae]|uniref:Lysosome-associated membrane glycoprotein 5 n=1 Tax=Menopon gallinae TaxID=328185 RepID=A0AAW2HUM3_9NEOP